MADRYDEKALHLPTVGRADTLIAPYPISRFTLKITVEVKSYAHEEHMNDRFVKLLRHICLLILCNSEVNVGLLEEKVQGLLVHDPCFHLGN